MDSIPVKDSLGVPHNMAVAETPDGIIPKHLASTAADKFFATFADLDLEADWELLEQGDGMTYAAPEGGGAVGASPYLRVSCGTTSGARTTFLSRAIFRAPIEVRFGLSASSRINNNTCRIGFLECDPVTGQIITSTSLTTAPEVLNARNAVVVDFISNTVTQGATICRQGGGGIDSVTTTFSGFTTAATGTAPDFKIADYMALSFERDRVTTRGFDQNATNNSGTQASRDITVPNATKSYRLALIFENTGAPASSVDWRIHFVNVIDAARFDVGFRNAGGTDASRAAPVIVLSAPTTTVSGTVTGNAQNPTSHFNISVAGTNATAVKTSAGNLMTVWATNLTGTVRYLKLYNKNAAPVVGTDIPVATFPIPANSFVSPQMGQLGIRFTSGISYCITANAADNDTTGIAADECKVVMSYV